MPNYLYFKATPELKQKRAELDARCKEVSQQAKGIADEVGGVAVFSDGRMVGVHFENGAPEGWKHISGVPKYENFFEPLVSKGLREIRDRMWALKKPTWDDVLSLINLDGHMVIGSPARGQRGFPMHKAGGEEIGDELIICVPVSKEPDDTVLGKPEYAGHELLIPISKADYLQLQADAERVKEAAKEDRAA